MDKNTIIAIVLSVIVISAGLAIQTIFFPPTPQIETASEVERIEEVQQAPSYALSSQAYNSGLPGSFQQNWRGAVSKQIYLWNWRVLNRIQP